MRSAMARFLTVNGFSASPPVPRGGQDVNFDPEADAAPEFGVAAADYGIEPSPAGGESASYGVSSTRYGVASTSRKNSGDQGPCLYFGPQGQRCDRRAIANGFCARHLPAQLGQRAQDAGTSPERSGVASLGAKPFGRIIAIGIAIFAALWPVVADLLHEIIRWIHAH